MFNRTKLKKIMVEKGVNSKTLAKRAGVSLRIVSYWLGGKKQPLKKQLPKLAKALGVNQGELVKERLAAIESEQIEPGHYVYHLEPDWSAIRARLSDAAGQTDPEMADWFRQGLEFIDDAFLSEAGADSGQLPQSS